MKIGAMVTTGNNAQMRGRITAVTPHGIYVQWDGPDGPVVYYLTSEFSYFALTVTGRG